MGFMWFSQKRFKSLAEKEIDTLKACLDRASDNRRDFSLTIQNLRREIEDAVKAIKEAIRNGEPQERIDSMKYDLSLLKTSLESRLRMQEDFDIVYGLLFEVDNNIDILYRAGRYKRVIKHIPEKSLPRLLMSGDHRDMVELTEALIKVNKELEDYLSRDKELRKIANQRMKQDRKVTDQMIGDATHTARSNFAELDDEFGFDKVEAEVKAGKANNNAGDVTVPDTQPVKVTKKSSDTIQTKASQ